MTDPRNDQLVSQLVETGELGDDWADVFRHVPRHLFIPDRIYVWDQGRFHVRTRHDDPVSWWSAVYSDTAITTQLDDGDEGPADDAGTLPSSSATMPSLVARMLAAATIRDGHRVLEVGTGTGYNAALLCQRLTDQEVYTIDVDPSVHETACTALNAAGYRPTLGLKDGDGAWPKFAPFDRLIATYAVTTIPHPWINQTRPDGIIIAPRSNPFQSSGCFRLEVMADGTAAGHVVIPEAAFMDDRFQRPDTQPGYTDQPRMKLPDASTTTVDPAELLDSGHMRFALGFHVTDVHIYRTGTAEDAWTLHAITLDGDSMAMVEYRADASEWRVWQGGPRRVWDEIATAADWYWTNDEPDPERFGVTVTADGQSYWLDSPETLLAP